MRSLRLAKLLREHFLRNNSSWLALERAIARAHRGKGRKTVDRRKLQKLAEGKRVPLYVDELEALDDYLSLYHQSLAHLPLFEHTELTSVMSATKKVHCFIGAREVFDTFSVSHFDTLAYGTLESQLNKEGPRVASDLHTVLLRGKREDTPALEEAYRPFLEDEETLISIASPVANHGSELLLARMFKCLPFLAPNPNRCTEIAFVLPEDHSQNVFSSFVEGPDQLRRFDPQKACKVTQRRWALRVGDQVFLASHEENQTRAKTYGLILAQRRANGHLWVVLAGLHGAGTYGAALALEGAELSPAIGARGADGLIHVLVVETVVSHSVSPRGARMRQVQEARVLPQFNRTYDPRSFNGEDERRAQEPF